MTDCTGKTVEPIAGRDVIIKELTVAELRVVLESRAKYDTLHHELFPDLALTEIPAFSSVSLEDLESFRPSQIEELSEKIKARNRHFFVMLARLQKDNQAA